MESRSPVFMSNKNFGRIKVPVLFLAVILTAIMFLMPLPFLALADQNNKPVLLFPLFKEKSFKLEYLHSVHKTPVEENFVIRNRSRMVLTATSFDSLGVGIPFAEGEGELVNRDGRFTLTGLNREFREINIKAVPLAEQSMAFANKRYIFNNYFAPGATIRLKTVRYTTAELLWHKFAGRKE